MGRPSAADRIAEMAIECITQRTRAEAAEAELRDVRKQLDEAQYAIDDLVKALKRERALNAAQCREADRD